MHAAALLLAPLILPAFTAWLRPVGLLTSRHGSRHATFIGYGIMFFTAALYAFSLAYVFANSARHARTEKIYPITGERNSQVRRIRAVACPESAQATVMGRSICRSMVDETTAWRVLLLKQIAHDKLPSAAILAQPLMPVMADTVSHAAFISGPQIMEDTLYALDELAGHWFPIACVWALFMLGMRGTLSL
jgi:hypothetical protein